MTFIYYQFIILLILLKNVFSKLEIVKKELQGDFQENSPDLVGWTYTGFNTPTSVLTCHVHTLDVKYMGPYGTSTAGTTNLYTLKKTFTGINPHHWSIAFETEILLIASYAQDNVNIYLDNNLHQVFKWDVGVFNLQVYQSGNNFCDYTGSSGWNYAQYIKPSFNTTHTQESLEFKIEFSAYYQYQAQSLALSNIIIYVDTCHESCNTCSGPAEDQCLTCPTESVRTGSICTCNENYFVYKWTCVQSCPVGYTLNGKQCLENCSEENCASCTNFQCTSCNSPYYLLRGICLQGCPHFTTASGQNCVDNMTGQYNNQLIFYDDFMRWDILNYEYHAKNWYFNEQTYTDYYNSVVYTQPGFIGQKCQSKGLMGGSGTIMQNYCNGAVNQKCEYQKTYTNLPPHFKAKIRFQIYLLDEWSNGYYTITFNGVANEVGSVYTTDKTYLCGFNRQYPQDDTINYVKEINHTNDSIELKLWYYSDQYTNEQTAGFREISLVVATCLEECSACLNETECTQCIGTQGEAFSRQGLQCQCPTNYFDKLSLGLEDCQICENDHCVQCDPSDGTICIECLEFSNREGSDCSCIQGYYDDGVSIACSYCLNVQFNRCATCPTNPSTACDTCISANRTGNTCECIDGYFDTLVLSEPECLQCGIDCFTCTSEFTCIIECDISCLGCQNTQNECINCRSNRFKQSTSCICNSGYYEANQEDCQACHVSCDGCNPANGNCLSCQPTRVVGADPTQCVCDPFQFGIADEVIPQRFFTCTTCDSAVTNIYFSDTLDSIIIDFPVLVNILGFDNPQVGIFQTSPSEELCSFILDQDSIDILGDGVKCFLNYDDRSQIILALGNLPTVDINRELTILPNSILRDDGNCNSLKFQNMFGKEVRAPLEIEKPTISIKGPTDKIIPCFDIELVITQAQIDGNRDLLNIQWQLFNTTKTTDFKDILSSAENQYSLIIPALTLEENAIYFFEISFTNFIGSSSSLLYELKTSSKEGIYNEIVETSPFVLKNYKVNYFEGIMRYFDCKTGFIQEKDKSFDVKWNIIETDGSITNLVTKTSTPTQKISQYEMAKYQFAAGLTYNLQFKVNIPGSDTLISTVQTQFEITNTKLLTLIEGGNRSHGYDQILTVQGIGKNIDLVPEQQEIGIEFEWQCIFLSDPSVNCQTIDGIDLNVNAITDNKLEFQEKVLQPYKSFLFQLSTTDTVNNSEEGLAAATIIIVETNLPLLTVNLPQNIISQEINKNDDLQVDINYAGNPDNVFYSLTIFYEFNIVATKNFQYTSYSFKIWDLFDVFTGASNQILIRISLYDPNYFMPSQSSFTVSVNMPPSNGSLQITQTGNIPIQDIFKIEALNYFDISKPLKYQYHIYTNQNAYLEDREQGNSPINFKKHVIQQFTNNNQYSSILPLGDYNTDTSKYELLVMVSVSDSQDGIFNATQIVETIPDPNILNIDQELTKIQNKYNEVIALPQYQWFQTLNILAIQISRIDINGQLNNCNNQGTYNSQTLECDCNQNYYLRDCSANESQLINYLQLKKQIYDSIEQVKLVQTDLTMLDQTIKCQKLLLQGNLMGLVMDNNNVQSQLQNINSIINNNYQELTNIVSQNVQNSGDSKITKKQGTAQGTLGSTFGVLDSLQKSINYASQNPNLRRRILQTTSLSNQDLNTNLNEIVKLQKKTALSLQKVILPNSDEINYNGDSIESSIAKSTNKRLQDTFFTSQQLLPGFQENLNENTGSSQQTPYNPEIYRSTRNVQAENPYRKMPSFPYPNQVTQLQDIDIFLEDEDGEANSQEFEIQNEINMQFQKINQQSTNMRCIAKQELKFSTDNCITKEVENSDTGETEYICKCSKINPTTLIDDIDNIFANSNLQNVFQNEGISALSEFEFWKSVIFYSFILLQALFTYSLYISYKLDKKDQGKFKSCEEQEVNSGINTENQVQSSSNKNDDMFVVDQGSLNDEEFARIQGQQSNQENQNVQVINGGIQLDTDGKSNKQNQRLKKKQSQIYPFSKQQSVENGQLNLNMSNDIEQKSNLSKKSSPKISEADLIQSNQNTLNLDNSNKKLVEKKKKIDKEDMRRQQLESKLIKKNIIVAFVPSVHELFSIAYIYEEDISRMARFTIIYIKNCVILALSGTISQQMSIYYTILWSLIGSIFSAIPAAILTALYSKNKITKIIATFLSVVLIGTCYFIGITNAALVGVDQSNNWAVAFLSTLVLDQFGIQFFLGYLKLYLFNFSIGLGQKGSKIRKILDFNSQVQEQFT